MGSGSDQMRPRVHNLGASGREFIIHQIENTCIEDTSLTKTKIPAIDAGAFKSRKLCDLFSLSFICSMFLFSLLPNTHSFVLLPEHSRRISMKSLQRISLFLGTSRVPAGLHQSSTQTFDHEIPKHVAFICDGNSRWAAKRKLPASVGHLAGADRFVDIVEELRADGIEYCTFYGFSTENWTRPKAEIASIFWLMEQTARKLESRVLSKASNIELRLLGNLDDERIPRSLKNVLEELQRTTSTSKQRNKKVGSSKTLTVSLAVNYGGRQDIFQASQKLASAVMDGDIASLDDITEDTLASFLSTSGIPDPDMIIRTSGEFRLSNFMLWNCAYSEIYITEVLWPDFDQSCWRQALSWYKQRQRRFGSRHGMNLKPNHNETANNIKI